MKRMYICDGNVPECRKSFCAFNGRGDCMHTQDKSHARYGPPREWTVEMAGGKRVLFEKER